MFKMSEWIHSMAGGNSWHCPSVGSWNRLIPWVSRCQNNILKDWRWVTWFLSCHDWVLVPSLRKTVQSGSFPGENFWPFLASVHVPCLVFGISICIHVCVTVYKWSYCVCIHVHELVICITLLYIYINIHKLCVAFAKDCERVGHGSRLTKPWNWYYTFLFSAFFPYQVTPTPTFFNFHKTKSHMIWVNTDGASNGVVFEDFDGVLTWSLEHSWLLKKCRARCANVVIFIIHGYIKKERKKLTF